MIRRLEIITLSLGGLFYLPTRTLAAAERVPVEISISQDDLARLSATDRAAVEALQHSAGALFTIKDFKPAIPSSIFEGGAVVVRPTDLFQAPRGDELREIGGAPLSDVQKIEVKDQALIIVPSIKYPGQNHVLQLSRFLQKGRKNIRISFQRGSGFAYDEIFVQVGERLGGDFFSVKNGAESVGRAFSTFLASLVGVCELKPKFSDQEVAELLLKAAERPIVSPLEDLKTIEKINPILMNIGQASNDAWERVRGGLEFDLRNHLSGTGLSPSRIEAELVERLTNERVNRFYARLNASPELLAIGEKIPELLIRRHRAALIVDAASARIARATQETSNQVRAEILAKDSIRAWSSWWLERQVAKRTKAFYAGIRWTEYAKATEELRAAHLDSEATAFAATLDFAQKHGDEYRDLYKEQEVAAANFVNTSNIWLKRNWRVKNIGTIDKPNFRAETSNPLSISTALPLWRVGLALQLGTAILNNMFKRVFMDNLWNGHFGLRVYGRDDFVPDYNVNSATGAIEPRQSSKVFTYWSNFRRLRDVIEGAVARADAEQSMGILPEWANRMWARIRYRGPGYLIAMPVLAVGQPATTALVGVTSAATACLGIYCAYGVAAASWMSDFLFWDRHAPKSQNRAWPIPNAIFNDFALQGIGQTFFAALAAVPVHPLIGTLGYGVAVTRLAAESAWDGVMRGLLLNRATLRIPRLDKTWAARRIEGPGLNNNYLFQIRPELAVVALQASLEGIELENYKKTAQREINTPADEGERLLNSVFAQFIDVGTWTALKAAPQIKAGIDAARKTLDAAVDARLKLLPMATANKVSRDKIRLSAADLEKTMNLSAPLVKDFYQKKLAPSFNDAQRAEFWNGFKIAEDDFATLARELYARTFGEKILVSLEESDPNFRLDVDEPSMSALATNIMQGLPVADLVTVAPTINENVSVDLAPTVALPLLNYRDALRPCESKLIDELMAAN